MEALEALRTRRSVRSFTDRAVDRADLETMVDCGRLAATANNVQPWEFVVVTQRPTLERLSAVGKNAAMIARAGACIAVVARDTKYYLEDGSAATQNLLVAARALGLGACWIAGDKKDYADAVLKLLAVPAGHRLISLVAVGHPAEGPSPSKRPLGETLHWEKF
ncbi:MAG: nitroreductase family protein [Candidatus Riflebacteria bacterium]|nr:nitroreductase family protein [Candidatus Riflebacteria bacterium]